MSKKIYPYISKLLVNGEVALLVSENYGVMLRFLPNTVYGECDEIGAVNVTADYLRNTKICIESSEHSEFVQKLVFGAGGWWFSGATWIKNISSKYIFIDQDLIMSHSSRGDNFNSGTEKEIKLPMPPKEEKQMNEGWPQIGDEVVVRSKHGAKEVHIKGVLEFMSDTHIIVNDCHRYRYDYDIEKPKDPLNTLSDLLMPLVIKNSRETSGYAAEQIAKAILAGEIEGLKYESK